MRVVDWMKDQLSKLKDYLSDLWYKLKEFFNLSNNNAALQQGSSTGANEGAGDQEDKDEARKKQEEILKSLNKRSIIRSALLTPERERKLSGGDEADLESNDALQVDQDEILNMEEVISKQENKEDASQKLDQKDDLYSGTTKQPEDLPTIKSTTEKQLSSNQREEIIKKIRKQTNLPRREINMLLINGIKNPGLNTSWESGINPIMIAAYYGEKEIIEALLKQGYALNEQWNKNGVLDYAELGGHSKIVDWLKVLKEDVKHQSSDHTDVMVSDKVREIASRKEDERRKEFPNPAVQPMQDFPATGQEKVQRNIDNRLLSKQQKKDRKTLTKGLTGTKKLLSIHEAVKQQDLEMIKMLVESGADINALNKNKETPLDLAVELNCESCKPITNPLDIPTHDNAPKETQLKFEIVKYLLENGAKTTDGNIARTPLLRAFELRQDKAAEMLLNFGVESHALPFMGLLQWGSYCGHQELVKQLIEKGEDVNLCVGKCDYPLNIAACQGHHNIVQILINAGAKINSGEDTPLYLVAMNRKRDQESGSLTDEIGQNYDQIIRILIESGTCLTRKYSKEEDQRAKQERIKETCALFTKEADQKKLILNTLLYNFQHIPEAVRKATEVLEPATFKKINVKLPPLNLEASPFIVGSQQSHIEKSKLESTTLEFFENDYDLIQANDMLRVMIERFRMPQAELDQLQNIQQKYKDSKKAKANKEEILPEIDIAQEVSGKISEKCTSQLKQTSKQGPHKDHNAQDLRAQNIELDAAITDCLKFHKQIEELQAIMEDLPADYQKHLNCYKPLVGTELDIRHATAVSSRMSIRG